MFTYPRRRTTQPKQPLPLAANNLFGLVFACYPIGNVFYDAVSGQFAAHVGTFRYRDTIDGNRGFARGAVGPSSGTGGQFTNQTGMDKVAGVHSVFCEFSLETNAANRQILTSWEGGGGNGFEFRADDVSLFLNSINYYVNNGALWNGSGENSLAVNSEQFTHRAAFTNDGANTRFYAKNTLMATAACTILPTAHANRRTTVLGRANAQVSGSGSLFLVANRVWTLSEYQSLYFNPWQVFVEEQQPAWVAAAAGGGATLATRKLLLGVGA